MDSASSHKEISTHHPEYNQAQSRQTTVESRQTKMSSSSEKTIAAGEEAEEEEEVEEIKQKGDINGHEESAVKHPHYGEESESSRARETRDRSPSLAATAQGRWGEMVSGSGVEIDRALEQFTELRRTLTGLSDQTKTDALGFPLPDLEVGDEGKCDGGENGRGGESRRGRLNLEKFVKTRSKIYQDAGIETDKSLGVTWKNLTVKGIDSRTQFVRTLPISILDTFGPQAFRFILSKFPQLSQFLPPSMRVSVRTLINDFNGSLQDEMCLVLGRPGAGCSTFLRAISNAHEGFVSVDGDLTFDGISSDKIKRSFRGETVYNAEEDEHFPTLSVWQTLQFAVDMKVPFRRPPGESRSSYSRLIVSTLLKMFGIEHTANTLVGNAFVRGVSGGERKRVSISEALATGATLFTWDNSTRGLDSATAVDYVRSLRILTDVAHKTSIVSLYQASESIYDLFDKVMLIDEGRMIFFGPADEARSYFEALGFQGPPRQTTPDFLTAITDPQDNLVTPGFEKTAPRTPEEREKAFRNSSQWTKLQADIEKVSEDIKQGAFFKRNDQFKRVVRQNKTPLTTKGGPWTVSLFAQTKALVKRQFLLKWGDRSSFYIKSFTNAILSLLVGSMYYGDGTEAENPSTEGAFSRGGAMFFSLILMGWMELGELVEAVSGRPIIARHKNFAFYRPGAVALARVVVDIPLLFFQAVLWSLSFYFLAQFERSAGGFFVYLLFVFTSAFSFSAFFRMVACLCPDFDSAILFSDLGLNVAVLMAGYAIPRHSIPSWFRWIFYVQPLTFSFEGLMSDQFRRITMECSESSLVPQGPNTSIDFQTCTFPGAQPGSAIVTGTAYIHAAFGYSPSTIWRDWGIVIAYIFCYVAATVFLTEFMNFTGSGASGLVFKRGSKSVVKLSPSDEEAHRDEKKEGLSRDGSLDEKHGAAERVEATKSVFTFRNICYDVITPDGPKRLLNDISGIVRPGETTALMGTSGAGKTTLLTTLSQRMNPAQVSGTMLVDGRPLDSSFQKMTGFAEQSDIHEETATILEAFEFSAVLRQPSHVPREEKLAYARDILRLLELEGIADALISSLSVEQKKRVTIGVELAARPSLLTWFDEPTSGLDSNGAMSIARLIRKLSANGQSCVATIHQPSSRLVSETFDRILLLSKGGSTCFNGPVSDVTRYFESKGARPCGKEENVAEYILEVVALPTPKESPYGTWGDIWANSEEQRALLAELDETEHQAREKPAVAKTVDDSHYSASLWEQTRMITIRIGRSFYRDPSYGYGKASSSFLVGIFIGFTFWQLGNTVADLQQAMFASFFIVLIVPALTNASIPRHFMLKDLWSAREHHTRTYSWAPLMTGILINELPFAALLTILYWPLYHWPVGLPSGEPAGYTFLAIFLFNLFMPSWTHWLCALFESPSMLINLLPFAIVVITIMNGIFVPWRLFPAPWKWFIYFANPLTYFIRGVIAATLNNRTVECASEELHRFFPPPGQSCETYAGEFTTQAEGRLFQEADGSCSFCQYTNANQYLATLNADPSFRWQDLGIFASFTVFNFILCYVLFYFMQVRGYSSSIGHAFSKLSKFSKQAF